MSADVKTCTRCGEVKPLEAYSRDRRTADGRRSRCKTCQRSESAAWRESHPDYHSAWYSSHKALKSTLNAAYRARHPEVDWEGGYRSRARKFGFEPVVERFTRAELTARYGDACAHCGGPFEQLDHYPVPVSRGGPHTLDNCRPSCGACNLESWKGTEDAQQAV